MSVSTSSVQNCVIDEIFLILVENFYSVLCRSDFTRFFSFLRIKTTTQVTGAWNGLQPMHVSKVLKNAVFTIELIQRVMTTTADSILLNSGPKSGHRSLTKKRRHSSPLNNCVFEYKTAIQRTSTVLVVRRGSAEVLRSVMQSINSSSSSNKRTFDILTSSWNQINFDSLAQGLAEISECNDENASAPSINEEDNRDSKVNLTTFFLLVI